MPVIGKSYDISSEIVKRLRSRLAAQEWKPGQKIATEKELCKEFDVCPVTIKNSLKVLEREGLLWSHRGKGRFVTDTVNRKKTHAIGVVLYDIEYMINPLETKLFSGIKEITNLHNYHLKIFALHPSHLDNTAPGDDLSWLTNSHPQTVIDGAIIVTKNIEMQQALALAAEVPVIWMNHLSVQPGLLGVRMDYAGGTYAAVRHLIGLGHRRLALVTAKEKFNVGHEQQDGFRLGYLETPGVEAKVFCGDRFSVDEGERLAHQILSQENRPTALVCGSDPLAIGVYQAMSRQGLTVPRDLSLVSMNDTLTERDIPLPVSCVRGNLSVLGQRCAESLLWMMDHPGEFRESEVVPTEYVARASTAPCV